MESENGIGIDSGDGEIQIGQDNFMDCLNNVDSRNNSKIANNSSPRQCVICLVNLNSERNEKDNGLNISSKDIDINVKKEPVDFDGIETENRNANANGTDFDEIRDDAITEGNIDADEDSLLKLLNVKVQVPFPPSPTRRNSPSQSSSYYCDPCSSRNKEISSLFSQIDELSRKLSSLKDGIESDFKDSFKRTMDTESNYPACINSDDIIDRKDFLRHHIAKSFNFLVIELPARESVDLDHPPVLIPDLPPDDLGIYFEDKSDIVMNDNDADADADDDDDWEPILIVPKVAFSGSDSDSEPDANDLDFKINVRSTRIGSTTKLPVMPKRRGRPPKKSRNKRIPPQKYLKQVVEAGQADLTSNQVISTNKNTTDYTNLKKLHGIRNELGILVKRLPPHILAQYDMPPSADVVQNNNNNTNNTNSRQLRSRLTLAASARQKQMLEMKTLKVQRNKRGQSIAISIGTGVGVGSRRRKSKSDVKFEQSQARSERSKRAAAAAKYAAKAAIRKTPLKCIFDDCQTNEVFHSLKEQENHMRAAHSQLYEVSASEDEEEKRKKTEKPTQYKCLFADCSTFEFYKTEEEMNAHIKAIHGIDMDEVNDPSENDDSGDNENDYDNNSINLYDGDNDNNMDDDFLDQDNQPPSPFSNPDESITTADGETQAENSRPTPKPMPKPNRKPYTKSKPKSKNRLPSRYKCIFTDCDSQEIFNTLADRDKHVQAVHSDTLKPLEETEAEKAKRLDRRERQKLRAKIIRDPNIAPKPRLHCFVEGCKSRRYFASDEEREMHMKKIHEGVTHPFKCTDSECGRAYRSNQELGVHVKSVHFGEFSHMCHFCGKGFTSIANLNAHIPKHTQERNFKCETCLQTFKTQSGLVYHRRAIHMGDNERTHCCDRCGKSFFTAVKLNNHIKCVHFKTDKPIICDVCGKRFAIRNYLYMHMKVHKNQTQNQGKGSSLGSAGDSADLSLSVSEGTKPYGVPPKKVARKRTSKPIAHRNNSTLNSSGSDIGFPGQDHHHGSSAKMEEERYLYATQDPQDSHSHGHGHNSSEIMNPTPNTAGSSARLSYEPAIINIPHNSFNPHSESNSNLSTASGSTGTGARPGSNPPVPVDLSSNYQDQQQQVQYSNLNSTLHHPRGVNITRHFLCGDFPGQGPSGMILSHHPGPGGSGGGGVGDNNPAGHGHFSNSLPSSIHNFLGIPGGSSSGTSSAGHQGTAMPSQIPPSSSSSLSLQHQYLQLTSTLENLGGFHPKF